MKFGSKYQTAAWITPDEVLPKPKPGWKAQDYSVQPINNRKLKAFREGHRFNLGGDTTIDVLHFPGHSKVLLAYPAYFVK